VYRAGEFAKLAGITTKALRHYERLGLLKPARSSAGYRLYADRHLERLEQILALKFLGLPLKEIRAALDRTPRELPQALRMQRRALLEKQDRVGRAIRAIEAAERAIESGGAPDEPLRKLIEVMRMQDAIEAMKRYYSTDAEWEKRRSYYEEGPGPEWRALYRDAAAVLGEDAGSDAVQAVADRWLTLTLRAQAGDPAVQQDSAKAWMDRANWPEEIKARLAEHRLEEIADLIRRAALCARKKYFTDDAWKALQERRALWTQHTPAWQQHVDLFRAVETALGEDPAGERGQSLARQWNEVLDTDSGSNPSVRAGLVKCWADRRNWSAVLRWIEEGAHMMSGERFDRVAEFLERAAARP
jgi:DNA-binding transcriptional MerR regulator